MLQLFQNDTGYEFSYHQQSVQLKEGTIIVDGVDILGEIQSLKNEREEQRTKSVVLGLKYQNEKYRVFESKIQVIAMTDFKYFRYGGNGVKNAYVLQKNDEFFLISWVSPLEPIAIQFGIFTSTFDESQWVLISLGNIDPSTIVENVNITNNIAFLGFLGRNSRVWDSYSFPQNPILEFCVI